VTRELLAAHEAEENIAAWVVADRAAAEHYVAKVCFKTGPPRDVGIELEWTTHHRDDPTRPLDPAALSAALGDHAPSALRPTSPHEPLPHGSVVTVEPGGQVEISSPPRGSLAELLSTTAADLELLRDLLGCAGLGLGDDGCDPHRPPRRVLDTPRYTAMERAFDRLGPHGRTMMCNTASVQVCLDAGTADRVAARWAALHRLGPVLLATFANSSRHAGWASARMRTWFCIDPTLARPAPPDPDPAAAWARHALGSRLLCVRRGDGCWDAPPGVTFADWLAGALPTRPTYGDLDYHLSTLFPLVRPRGYVEVRYLDAQPGDDWVVPVALVAALFAREDLVDEACGLAERAADRWLPAARDGLADPVLGDVAPRVLDVACEALDHTDLSPTMIAAVTDAVHRRLTRGRTR
jgi:glutamate--cysteine ligase